MKVTWGAVRTIALGMLGWPLAAVVAIVIVATAWVLLDERRTDRLGYLVGIAAAARYGNVAVPHDVAGLQRRGRRP